jgi:hypothetical protein
MLLSLLDNGLPGAFKPWAISAFCPRLETYTYLDGFLEMESGAPEGLLGLLLVPKCFPDPD